MINKLTPEQEALIPVYIEKWISLALSTEPIARQKAAEAVNVACTVCWKEEPKILFFDSLYSFLKNIDVYFPDWEEGYQIDWLAKLEDELFEQLSDPVTSKLCDQLLEPMDELLSRLWNPLLDRFYQQPEISRRVVTNFAHDVNPQDWLVQCSFIDFCFSVLNCSLNESEQREWEVLQSLVKSCGWIYIFVKHTSEDNCEFVCIVCDRPTKLLYDHQQLLHAEEEPAIQFADGFSIYAYHGVGLPEN
ncbi:hypothetical protein NDI37_22430 [Funiculus sociatus GB2-A5]|uniref:DUF6745 domain-containing protein n=1 Tax=Funiculus sociatus GB2-A5 TaxID=2933946 RepID=A0ABV0JUV5_9CYAN|nr:MULTISPECIES: hypothetical protein [unclassified Trichocoleus]MBD1907988.1 hypothetical protein [Trichocoleus sp. FACHB-832]MBD2065129.1 hypothetical protein [Trichocoleus sp. FACHB-6]